MFPAFIRCDKFGVIGDVAHRTLVELPGIQPCTGGSLATPEAFVLKHCQTNSSSSWALGSEVSFSCSLCTNLFTANAYNVLVNLLL